MTEISPLVEAQQKFAAAVPFRSVAAQSCVLAQALGRTLYTDLTAPGDSPPYHRAIVEGFVVNTAETQAASEETPVSFAVVGEIKPGDEQCPAIGAGEALRVSTGSILADGPFSVVRMWEANCSGGTFTISRPFPPRFFIEESGCDHKAGDVVLTAGTLLTAADLGVAASLGVEMLGVASQPTVTLFSSGDEVVPHTAALAPGSIRDCNSIMLAAAVTGAGGIAHFGGIMRDDFDAFVSSARQALEQSDMLLISGGTAVGDRDFISDLVSELGELLVDGVPMRSGRPLIMGVAGGKPIICVAGHPPEALRGFNLFGVAAMNRLLGRDVELPTDAVTN
ncbi:MAG: molybdopterin molybdotransferase MoeA [Gammaproteobacteria bacterium]|nr:molybdopterin molybdotransferase MoeA [Gammaproteobacteria bacterium]